MKKAIIVCEIIKEDIKHLIENMADLDVFYMESKLHNDPELLRTKVQEKIDSLFSYDEVILSYGLCGNGMAGIKATNCRLVFPKVDDCICAMMCHSKEYGELRKASFFTSRGWLSVGRTFSEELKYINGKYNKKTAELILKSLYGNYKYLIYMQTEDRVTDENRIKAEEMSNATGMQLEYKKADLKIYEDLLKGIQNERIGSIEKGEVLKVDSFLSL